MKGGMRTAVEMETPLSTVFASLALSTGPGSTVVVVIAESATVAASLALATLAEAETVCGGFVNTVPLTVMAGSPPPAGTGPGFVHTDEAMLQDHPVPEAALVAKG